MNSQYFNPLATGALTRHGESRTGVAACRPLSASGVSSEPKTKIALKTAGFIRPHLKASNIATVVKLGQRGFL
jgi:hypothetical protein